MHLLPRDVIAALRQQIAEVVPALEAFGVSRVHDARVSLLYSYPFGLGEFDVPEAAVPPAVAPRAAGHVEVRGDAIYANPTGVFEAFLRQGAVRQVLALDVPGVSDARFWVGGREGPAATADTWTRLTAVAATVAPVLESAEPEDALHARLRRLERTSALLPALLQELDIREVFGRVSATATEALPHDVLLLRLFNDDLSEITVYASSDQGTSPQALPNAYPASLIEAWAFDIVDDLRLHPYEAKQPPAKLGARSSLRVPIRVGDRVIGGLAVLSFTPAAFSPDDVPIARRLAEHLAVGLSHHRMAEARRTAAVLKERTSSLELLDGLVGTLTGVLDVREVFEQVSAIARKVLRHDMMSLLLLTDDRQRVVPFAVVGDDFAYPETVPVPDYLQWMVSTDWDHLIYADAQTDPLLAEIPPVKAGYRAVLSVPVRRLGEPLGTMDFWSSQADVYTPGDVLIAHRIADHVALALSHHRLAEQGREAAALRARAASLEMLDGLLGTLTDVLDLREVFERVSTVARAVLPHDAAALLLRVPDTWTARRFASVGLPADLPEVSEIPPEIRADPDWDHVILPDLTARTSAASKQLVGAGFRSLLQVSLRHDQRFAGALLFYAKEVRGFADVDVPIARRIADRMAVALARTREIDAERRADEATERAARLEARVRALTDELDARTGYRRVIGESKQWRDVLTQATQVAATDTTALLLGESGTGKEVVARFVHRASKRSGGPFVALNCAALPEQLLEAELFGYERGAFTGAVQSKPGQLEQAAGGTLFLDEVGEMSPTAQAKFLRVLQEREFQRLGGTRVLRSEARIVAATNRDLPRAIAQGHFREDLYYRLNVFAIRLPPLRDRREDVLPLSEAFLVEIGRGFGRPPGGLTREARDRLLAYRWPGNVRELRNVLERAAILCDGGLITPDLLALAPEATDPPASAAAPVATARPSVAEVVAAPAPPEVLAAPPDALSALSAPTSAGDLASIERSMIEKALAAARFNKSKAATALGLTRHQLYIRMRKHGLE